MPRKSWAGRIYHGRDEDGRQQFHWLGRFPTKRERDLAVAKALLEKPWEAKTADRLTCDEWADRYLERYERTRKASSHDTASASLRLFRATYGNRPVGSITPIEAEDWSQTVPRWAVPQVVAMFNYARRMRVVDFNPFDGLSRATGRGRADEDPPTVKEMERLLTACDALGGYAQQMRDFINFAALTLLRPGELYELRYPDVDLVAHRITISRRLYRGRVDTPKSGRAKMIALVPPARDLLLRQPTRGGELVFLSMRGCRLSTATMHTYWREVREAAKIGRDMPLYLATKHLGVSNLYRLGLSARAIAAQAGWSEKSVEAMLAVYGHKDLIALAEVDALYDRSDAVVTLGGLNVL